MTFGNSRFLGMKKQVRECIPYFCLLFEQERNTKKFIFCKLSQCISKFVSKKFLKSYKIKTTQKVKILKAFAEIQLLQPTPHAVITTVRNIYMYAYSEQTTLVCIQQTLQTFINSSSKRFSFVFSLAQSLTVNVSTTVLKVLCRLRV